MKLTWKTEAPSSSRLVRSSSVPISMADVSPALEVSRRQIHSFLQSVDSLGQVTGALYYHQSGQEFGVILVERGRICWAVARGLRERLTDLLRHQASPPIDQEMMENIYQACRMEQKPLGEYLVERQLIRGSGFRAALRQHTAEAIAMLATAGIPSEWKPHRNQTYDPSFTFTPAEIYSTVGLVQFFDEGAVARSTLANILIDEATGLAFRRDSNEQQLIGYYGPLDLTLDEVEEIGRWARSGLDISRAVDDSRRLITVVDDTGIGLTAWSQGSIDFAVLTEHRLTLAKILGHSTRTP